MYIWQICKNVKKIKLTNLWIGTFHLFQPLVPFLPHIELFLKFLQLGCGKVAKCGAFQDACHQQFGHLFSLLYHVMQLVGYWFCTCNQTHQIKHSNTFAYTYLINRKGRKVRDFLIEFATGVIILNEWLGEYNFLNKISKT